MRLMISREVRIFKSIFKLKIIYFKEENRALLYTNGVIERGGVNVRLKNVDQGSKINVQGRARSMLVSNLSTFTRKSRS